MDLCAIAYIQVHFESVYSCFVHVIFCLLLWVLGIKKQRSCVVNLLSKFRIMCLDVLTFMMQEVSVFMCNEVFFLLQRIEWHSTGAHRELCYLKGKSEVSPTAPSNDCIFIYSFFSIMFQK